MYHQKFVDHFQDLTGLDINNTRSEEGWISIPEGVVIGDLSDDKYRFLTLCGSRKTDDGWWIKPWPVLEEGRVVAVTLTDIGVKRFKFLQASENCRRHLFYVDKIDNQSRVGLPVIYGQFLAEMVIQSARGCPDKLGSYINYPSDLRVKSFDPLTPEEDEAAKQCLSGISEALL